MLTNSFMALLYGVLLLVCVTVRLSSSDFSHLKGMDEAQADFALDMLRLVADSDESTIFSPLSITTALSMVYFGAGGETKQQMAKVLGRGQNENKLERYLALLTAIDEKKQGYTLDVANRLYLSHNFTVKKAYLQHIKSQFAGEVEQVDFKQVQAVVQKINAWVEQQTKNKIKDLISADNIQRDTSLMLVNAVYFKGTWEKKFEERSTSKKIFYSSVDKYKEVEMMKIKAQFPYYEDESVQVLGLPYTGCQVHMFILLPIKQDGLYELERKLTGKQLLDYIEKCDEIEVEVELPKFKLEQRVELKDVLSDLGMVDVFSHAAANLKGISDEPLYVSDVIHKAFIEVNEKGTEAAGATAIGIRLRSAAINFGPLKTFRADHPYLFVITHQYSKLLFSGRMV